MRPPPTITSMSLTENYKENDGSNEKIKVNPVLKKTTCLASALMNESPIGFTLVMQASYNLPILTKPIQK